MPRWQLTLITLSLLALLVAILGVRAAKARYYRCPRCNAALTGSGRSLGGAGGAVRWGFSENPATCPGCGAKLR